MADTSTPKTEGGAGELKPRGGGPMRGGGPRGGPGKKRSTARCYEINVFRGDLIKKTTQFHFVFNFEYPLEVTLWICIGEL